jgi:phosphotransacetylase
MLELHVGPQVQGLQHAIEDLQRTVEVLEAVEVLIVPIDLFIFL